MKTFKTNLLKSFTDFRKRLYNKKTIEDEKNFENCDINHQGTVNNRTLRLYSANIRCRGSFGAYGRNTVVITNGLYEQFYVNGMNYPTDYLRYDNSKIYSGTTAEAHTYHKIHLYPALNNSSYTTHGNCMSGDAFGFPVDVIVFDSSFTGTNYWAFDGGDYGKFVLVINMSASYQQYISAHLGWQTIPKLGSVMFFRQFDNNTKYSGGDWMPVSYLDL